MTHLFFRSHSVLRFELTVWLELPQHGDVWSHSGFHARSIGRHLPPNDRHTLRPLDKHIRLRHPVFQVLSVKKFTKIHQHLLRCLPRCYKRNPVFGFAVLSVFP